MGYDDIYDTIIDLIEDLADPLARTYADAVYSRLGMPNAPQALVDSLAEAMTSRTIEALCKSGTRKS